MIRVPGRRHPNQTALIPPQHRDLAEPSITIAVPADVQQHLHRSGELAVQREAVEAAERRERLEAGGHLGGIVRVHGPRAAVVAGVERGQQIDDLGAAHFADDDAVGPHPQRLSHQVPHGDLAYPFDIRAPRDELHQVRMSRLQLGGILHADDALAGRHRTESGGQQRRLSRAGTTGDQKRQPRGDDLVE